MTTMIPTSATLAPPACLLVAFELGERIWIAAGAVDDLAQEVARAKGRLRLPAAAPVVSCFEAGRDGFWLHRCLVAPGHQQPRR